MHRLLTALTLASAVGLAAPGVHAAGPARAFASGHIHTVYPGQTLAMIAKRYNVSIEALCKANRITKRSPIHPKQKLVIPSKDGDVVPAALIRPAHAKDEREKTEPDAKDQFQKAPRK